MLMSQLQLVLVCLRVKGSVVVASFIPSRSSENDLSKKRSIIQGHRSSASRLLQVSYTHPYRPNVPSYLERARYSDRKGVKGYEYSKFVLPTSGVAWVILVLVLPSPLLRRTLLDVAPYDDSA
ncbi:hypothetical protein EDB85DRAFT_1963818 [Lactarius pseudohatsudake]|nr:hypothetical protein EDB85DRAFT_1963818 [Lactarius pseudohatsudake]